MKLKIRKKKKKKELKAYQTTIPSFCNPSFAASFLAAFLVFALPLPWNSPSTMTFAYHTGVVFVPLIASSGDNPTSAYPSSIGSPPLEYIHSTCLPAFCRCWLKSARCPMVPVKSSLTSVKICDGAEGSLAGGLVAPPMKEGGIAGRRCC